MGLISNFGFQICEQVMLDASNLFQWVLTMWNCCSGMFCVLGGSNPWSAPFKYWAGCCESIVVTLPAVAGTSLVVQFWLKESHWPNCSQRAS